MYISRVVIQAVSCINQANDSQPNYQTHVIICIPVILFISRKWTCAFLAWEYENIQCKVVYETLHIAYCLRVKS